MSPSTNAEQELRRVGRMRRRHWWVCCYAAPGSVWSHRERRWIIPPNRWRGGRRRWHLLMVKTFRTIGEAVASRSLQRLYAPFSNPAALVVLMRARATGKTIVELALYADREGY